MRRRLTVEYSESRSQTVRTRLELSLDGPPVRDPSGPPVQPAAGAVGRYPHDAPGSVAETENDA